MNTAFTNQTFIITGASSGIGKALAIRLLEQGAQVSVCGRDLKKLNELAQTLQHPNLFIVQADVSIESDCAKLIDETIKKFGKINVLINNAGISMRALFQEVDLAVLRQSMDINFWGTVYCTKYALPHILKTKGSILGISSIAGYKGLPCRTGYSASKFAMQGFLESLRIELLPQHVNVLWVSPGFVASNIRNTALNAQGLAQSETPLDEKNLMSAEECAERILKAIQQRKRSLIMTAQGKLTVWMNKFFPSFVDKQVYKHFLHEPDSPLQNIKPSH